MLAFQRFLIVSAAALLPAAASAASIAQEPDSPFTKGKDVEWTESHVGGTAVVPEMHRSYHRDAQDKHAAWHAERKDMDHASGDDVRAHRLHHRMMNESHRKFHRGLTDEDEGFLPGDGWTTSDWTMIEEGVYAPRPTAAQRPSRRTLREEVLLRQLEQGKSR